MKQGSQGLDLIFGKSVSMPLCLSDLFLDPVILCLKRQSQALLKKSLRPVCCELVCVSHNILPVVLTEFLWQQLRFLLSEIPPRAILLFRLQPPSNSQQFLSSLREVAQSV